MPQLVNICQLVSDEYSLLMTTYEGFNDLSFTLKGWSVTVSLAAIFAVYSEKLGAQGKVLLWSAALSSLPFWALDALWKLYQQAYVARIEYLERIPNCFAAEPHNFKIYESWGAEFKRMKFSLSEWICAIGRTAFPHVGVLLIGVILALKFPPKQGANLG